MKVFSTIWKTIKGNFCQGPRFPKKTIFGVGDHFGGKRIILANEFYHAESKTLQSLMKIGQKLRLLELR